MNYVPLSKKSFKTNEHFAKLDIFGHVLNVSIKLNCNLTVIRSEFPCESVMSIGIINVPFEFDVWLKYKMLGVIRKTPKLSTRNSCDKYGSAIV